MLDPLAGSGSLAAPSGRHQKYRFGREALLLVATRHVVPRAGLRERHGTQRAAQASGHDAHVERVEGACPRGPDGTRASRPVDAPHAQAMGGNGCRRERGLTDRRTPRSCGEGHGGHAQPAGCTVHRRCRRQHERKHASNLHPRRAYAVTLSPWPDRSEGSPRETRPPFTERVASRTRGGSFRFGREAVGRL